jgi:hypothetical protein
VVALSCPSDCTVHVCNDCTKRLLHVLGVQKDLNEAVDLSRALPRLPTSMKSDAG